MASPRRGAKFDLDVWPHDPKSIWFLPSSSACEVWKWLDINCSLYCANNALYTECQSWPLTPWSKINRVPPLIISNLHVKFESDWAKTIDCIVSTRSHTQSAKVDLWPRDPKSIGFLLSSSTTHHNVKFESDWAKIVVYILPTRSYRQSAKVDLDLWSCDPKSIGFLLSSSSTYM